LNLLQGELAPAGQIRQRLRPLLPAAVMLALWLAGTLVFNIAEWWKLRHQYQSYRQEMTAILLEAFPDTRTVLDPARQFERGLEQLAGRGGAPHDLLALLSRLAPALGEDARVRLRGLRYTERSVTLELTLPDAQTLEVLKQALRSRGLQAEILAATPRGAEVEGRLRVQPLAAGAATGSPS
jgi:general secretion pathway protein L